MVRADASAQIGMGHVVRCVTLANALRKKGVRVVFAARDFGGGALEWIRALGFDLHLVQGGASTERHLDLDDALTLRNYALESGSRALIVDHYGASAEYFAACVTPGILLGAIDDLADRELTACNWILNQNIGARDLSYRTRPECIRLLGPDFALVREEFVETRRSLQHTFSEQDHRVLITLGGGNMLEWVLRVLDELEAVDKALELRCIARGSGKPWDVLTARASRSHHHVECINGTDAMAQHMAWADVSINAGGSTCWELMCLGVPMMTIPLSPDQRPNTRRLAELGYAVEILPTELERLSTELTGLLENPQRRKRISEMTREVVDGMGADRAADSLLERI